MLSAMNFLICLLPFAWHRYALDANTHRWLEIWSSTALPNHQLTNGYAPAQCPRSSERQHYRLQFRNGQNHRPKSNRGHHQQLTQLFNRLRN